LLATLPSPIVWGFIVDSACIRWNRTCGDLTRGACSIYNSDALRLRTHITYGVMRLVSLISDAWVFYYAKDLRLTDEDPDPIVNEAAAEGVIDKDRKFSL
uniref:EXS domain-containing protein n=1 Tax=Anisakis simplex TaxID=6269 RepID=A0A0M3JB98_ANISI